MLYLTTHNILLCEVETEKEAFAEMRRYLEINGIVSRNTIISDDIVNNQGTSWSFLDKLSAPALSCFDTSTEIHVRHISMDDNSVKCEVLFEIYYDILPRKIATHMPPANMYFQYPVGSTESICRCPDREHYRRPRDYRKKSIDDQFYYCWYTEVQTYLDDRRRRS